MTNMIGDYRCSMTEHRVYITNDKSNQHISMPKRDWLAMCQPSVIKRQGAAAGREPDRGRLFYEIYTWGEVLSDDDSRKQELTWDGLKLHVQARWNMVYDEARVGRCGYNQFEPDSGTHEITHEEALESINLIRNSIIGAQMFNWSEHMYPLVSILNRAGFPGLEYPKAKANIGTLIERANTAEALLRKAAERLRTDGAINDALELEAHLESVGAYDRDDEVPA